MDYYPVSERQAGKADNEEYTEKDGATGKRAEKEPEQGEYDRSRTDWESKREDQEGERKVNPPAKSESRPKASKKKKKVKMPRIPLVYKILAVVAVYFNFRFIWHFMKEPAGPFYHKLIVLGICAGINFIAVWVLFSRRSLIRFYLSLFAILGSVGYYFYLNYTNHSFLGHNLIISVLMALFVLMVINPAANYYLKSILVLLIPIIGIYLSSNKLALVWILMGSAGLILLFRLSNLQAKPKEKPDKRAIS